VSIGCVGWTPPARRTAPRRHAAASPTGFCPWARPLQPIAVAALCFVGMNVFEVDDEAFSALDALLGGFFVLGFALSFVTTSVFALLRVSDWLARSTERHA
jgi:hypothetical protein